MVPWKKPMMLASVGGLLFIAACSESASESLELRNSTLEAANADIRGALARRNYEDAVKSLLGMTRLVKLQTTAEQQVSMKNAIRTVKMELAEAAADGDTNALAAIRFLKMNSAAAR
jgi:hypothetical protein